MAGGHLGFKADQIASSEYCWKNLIPQVVNEINTLEEKYQRSIPVIAARAKAIVSVKDLIKSLLEEYAYANGV